MSCGAPRLVRTPPARPETLPVAPPRRLALLDRTDPIRSRCFPRPFARSPRPGSPLRIRSRRAAGPPPNAAGRWKPASVAVRRAASRRATSRKRLEPPGEPSRRRKPWPTPTSAPMTAPVTFRCMDRPGTTSPPVQSFPMPRSRARHVRPIFSAGRRARRAGADRGCPRPANRLRSTPVARMNTRRVGSVGALGYTSQETQTQRGL